MRWEAAGMLWAPNSGLVIETRIGELALSVGTGQRPCGPARETGQRTKGSRRRRGHRDALRAGHLAKAPPGSQ